MKFTRKEFLQQTVRKGIECLLRSIPIPGAHIRKLDAPCSEGEIESLYRAAMRQGIDPATMSRGLLRQAIEELENESE